jgi:uncharacterized RmlC-like cupin family protein
MARIIRADDLPKDVTYEPPLGIEFGVNNWTCGAEGVTSGRTYVPPGGKNSPHMHPNAEASMYIMQGALRVLHGPEGGPYREEIAEQGSFVYVEKGGVHGLYNVSDTEPAWIIFAYGGVPNKEAAGFRVPAEFQDLDQQLRAAKVDVTS